MSVNEYCSWVKLYRNVSVLPIADPALGSVYSPSQCDAFWTASVMVYNATCDASNACTQHYSTHGQMYPKVNMSQACGVDIGALNYTGHNDTLVFTQYRSTIAPEVIISSQANTALGYNVVGPDWPINRLFEYSEWNSTSYVNLTNYGPDALINSGCPICTTFNPGVYLQMCYFNCTEAPLSTFDQFITYSASQCITSLNSNGKVSAAANLSASTSIMLFGLIICLAKFLPIIQ
ncbi:unnamed protein product [Umbelopsis ramanniana]